MTISIKFHIARQFVSAASSCT